MIRHRLPLPAVAFAISMALTAAACAGSSSSTSAPGGSSRTGEPSAARATATGSIDVSRLKGRIAFSAGPPHAEDVYIVAANGSGLVQLTHDGVSEFDPSWSPDGDRIAYRHQPGDDDTTEIYVAAADGKAAHDVSGNDNTADWGPAWSTRGDWIAWNTARKARFGGFDLGLVRPDSSRLHLVKPGIHVEYPAWSPDGRRIAFMSQVAAEGLQYDIFVIDADGSHIRRLTTSPATDGFPSWSPDGTTIAFSSTRDACAFSSSPQCLTTGDIGPFHTLYLMNADGSHQRRLSKRFVHTIDWSPNGRYLVFGSRSGLAVVSADGSASANIPLKVGAANFPDWSR
jgi:Tol biopolymer transport system component